jgi:hypothetical protein
MSGPQDFDLIWPILGLAAFAILVAWLRQARTPRFVRRLTTSGIGIRAKPLLTDWERVTLARLDANLPQGYRANPQVRLMDMLKVDDSTVFRKLASLSVDFAVTDGAGNVLVVVELNDRSHNRRDRQERDALLARALASARIPLATFKPGQPVDLSPWTR